MPKTPTGKGFFFFFFFWWKGGSHHPIAKISFVERRSGREADIP